MAHQEQIAALKYMAEELGFQKCCSVLEIGSMDVNGSIREVFASDSYIGVDLAPGPGVDFVGSGATICLNSQFDYVIASEVFEHNPFWHETLQNMFAHVKSDGWILLTMATTGRFEHGTLRTDPTDSPGTSKVGLDYYRNISYHDLESAIKNLLPKDYIIVVQNRTFDLYAIISKSNEIPKKIENRLLSLRKLRITPLAVLREIYFLPPRLFMRVMNEEHYQTLCVYYEKYTKKIIKKLNNMTRKFYRQ